MADDISEFRRRIENLETNYTETRALLRENALIHARLNETLIEMKEEFRSLKDEMKQVRALEVEIANLKLGFAAIKWISGSLFGTLTLLILSYFFKVQVGVSA